MFHAINYRNCRVCCLCHTWEVFPSSIGKKDVCHRSPAYCRCTGLQILCQRYVNLGGSVRLLPPTSRKLCDICHGACYCNGRENLWKKALWIFFTYIWDQTYDSPNISVEGFDCSSCIAFLDMALAPARLDVVAQQGEGDQKPQVRKSDHIGGNPIPVLQKKVMEISY